MTWDHAGGRLGWGVLALGALLARQQAPTPGLPIVAAPADPVAIARAQDDAAFAAWLHEREILVAQGHLGRWIAIEGGQLLPRAADGKLAPAESLAELLFLIDPPDPAAAAPARSPHRYLFRIGEEGDVAYHYYAPNLPGSDALGVGLFRATFLDEPGSDVVFAPHRIYAKRGERKHGWDYGEKGIALALEDPARTVVVDAIVTPSNACDGTFVLSAATAARLDLARFEIPGTCWYGPEEFQRLPCRRARLRWRVEELGVDATLPVAIWPQR